MSRDPGKLPTAKEQIPLEVSFFQNKLQQKGYGFGDHVGTSAYKNWASAPGAIFEESCGIAFLLFHN